MNVYVIRWDSQDEAVEARSYGEAVKAWSAHMVEEWKREGCYELGHDETLEPEQVTLLIEGRGVIRAEGAS